MKRPEKFMHLSLWIIDEDEDEEGYWLPFYFDVSKVIGWYMPKAVCDGSSVNILVVGDEYTVALTSELKNYLRKHCY